MPDIPTAKKFSPITSGEIAKLRKKQKKDRMRDTAHKKAGVHRKGQAKKSSMEDLKRVPPPAKWYGRQKGRVEGTPVSPVTPKHMEGGKGWKPAKATPDAKIVGKKKSTVGPAKQKRKGEGTGYIKEAMKKSPKTKTPAHMRDRSSK